MPLDAAHAYYEASSPTLLSQQDPADADKLQRPGKDWDTIYAHLEARLAAMRAWRWSWWALWSSLAEYILPRRYKWLITANTYNRGNYINNTIVNETSTQSMETCAAGLWTGLTSPSRPWFKLTVQAVHEKKVDAEGKAWLEDTEQKLYTVLAGSNFYNIMAQSFQDVATFGTAPVLIYEHDENVIQCMLPCAGEYYLACGSSMVDDVLYREFTLTVNGIVDMFGLDNAPEEVRKKWVSGGAGLEDEFVIAHAIEPNFALQDRSTGRDISVVPGTFPFREVYWLKGKKTEAELSRKGFYEQPFGAMRWSVVSNDPYGRSLGMDNLGSTKQLQQMVRREGELIEKIVRPPMGGDPELKNEPASIQPGQLTYVNTQGGKKGFWPLFEMPATAVTPLSANIAAIEKRLKDGWLVNIFMAISQMEGVQPRNELELTKRDLERLQRIGPFIQLFETEAAGPYLKRTLRIMSRRGIIQPPPPSMRGVPVKIDFISILRLAQRAAETASMERTFAVAGNLSAAAKAAGVPDPIRIINLDEALRSYSDMVSFPSKVLFTADEVMEHDKERAQQAQQQQALQATLPAVQAAQTLSKTDVGGGNNALQAMLSGGGQ
jgi:head-to-tail connecting protein